MEYEYRAVRDGRWIIDKLGLVNVHAEGTCAGEHCVFHNPSDHHMLEWPPQFRTDTGIIERLCEHGVGHPDPDSLAWYTKLHGVSYHGCDGCCT